MRTLTPRERQALAVIGDAGEAGCTASEICRSTTGCDPAVRIWTAQQAGRVARDLAGLGFIRVQHARTARYMIRALGRGYLSVPDSPVAGGSPTLRAPHRQRGWSR